MRRREPCTSGHVNPAPQRTSQRLPPQRALRRVNEGAGARGTSSLEAHGGSLRLESCAGERGCRVTSITISKEQHDLARERVRAAGLEHLVDIRMLDYRDIDGEYDAVVSIEMLEAVGAEYFETYFEVRRAELEKSGAAEGKFRRTSYRKMVRK